MSTAGDRAILHSIFVPYLPLENFEEDNPLALSDDIGELTQEILEAKGIEKQAVALAEEGSVLDAIKAFSKAIEIAPQMPSLYNNRAQAYRLNNDIINALNDLNTTITISRGTGKSACLAYCQRALIFRKNNEEEKALEDFRKAAALGSPYAKTVLVQSNPYAALCSKMLTEMTEKLRKGVQQDNEEDTHYLYSLNPENENTEDS